MMRQHTTIAARPDIGEERKSATRPLLFQLFLGRGGIPGGGVGGRVVPVWTPIRSSVHLPRWRLRLLRRRSFHLCTRKVQHWSTMPSCNLTAAACDAGSADQNVSRIS